MLITFSPTFAVPDEKLAKLGQYPILMMTNELGRLTLTVEPPALMWGFKSKVGGGDGAVFPHEPFAASLAAAGVADPLSSVVLALEFEQTLRAAVSQHIGLLLLWPGAHAFPPGLDRSSYWAAAEALEEDFTLAFTPEGCRLV